MRPVGLGTSSKVWKTARWLLDFCSNATGQRASGWSSSAPWARLVVVLLLVIVLQQGVVAQRLLLVLEDGRKWTPQQISNNTDDFKMQTKKKSKNMFRQSTECAGIDSLYFHRYIFFFRAIQKLSLRLQWRHLVSSQYITSEGWNLMYIYTSNRYWN